MKILSFCCLGPYMMSVLFLFLGYYIWRDWRNMQEGLDCEMGLTFLGTVLGVGLSLILAFSFLMFGVGLVNGTIV